MQDKYMIPIFIGIFILFSAIGFFIGRKKQSKHHNINNKSNNKSDNKNK